MLGPELGDLDLARESERHLQDRKLSFTYDKYFPQPKFLTSQNSLDDILDFKKPELTCISEEGIADMELPDNLLDELEILENITSCNKVRMAGNRVDARYCGRRCPLRRFQHMYGQVQNE